MTAPDYTSELLRMGREARAAARKLAMLQAPHKNRCLEAMATALLERQGELLKANKQDMENGRKKGLNSALLDRLKLSPERITDMAQGLRTLVGLENPVGKIDATWIRPNGMKIQKVRVPIGVIAIIYEARPNVTADAAGLCLKAGNAVFLRGGSEAVHSNHAIAEAMLEGVRSVDLPEAIIQLLPWT
ncbi:MAG: aldehyde dehydrogenase family protein, partial [Candidatus Pacebacteria bacterium]|nr:aldehyde dehydrogenase family protein [Candidatus Paceibacterota bacterium]